MPSSSCSPTVSPVRGSTTRSAGWMRSPCSACSRQRRIRRPRGRRAGNPPSSTLPSRTERSSGGSRAPAAVERDVDGEAVAVEIAAATIPGRLREPFAPPVRHALEERRRLPAVERLHEPAPGLVAGLVLEPEHPLAVERRNGVDEPDRVIGHLRRRCPSRCPRRAPARPPTRSRRRRSAGRGRRPLRQERDRGARKRCSQATARRGYRRPAPSRPGGLTLRGAIWA